MTDFVLSFNEVGAGHINLVGGKNASLGEMISKLTEKGIRVPDGFAVTANAYWKFLNENDIKEQISVLLSELDIDSIQHLEETSAEIRSLISNGRFPPDLENDILQAYSDMCTNAGRTVEVAVRSSATAEDLPTASFAGQQESYLNINGDENLLHACKNCFASLFTSRAIKYRADKGFEHMNVALSVGVQQMVRSDKGASGVAFTIEPETGFDNVIVIDGAWGLGDNIVQGIVDPDEFVVFKPSLKKGMRSIISRKLGSKQQTLVYNPDPTAAATTINVDTSDDKRKCFILDNDEVKKLATWCLLIEQHYGRAMDIEWAKDGLSGELFIVQARPETVHEIKEDPHLIHNYKLIEEGQILASGIGLGTKIATGTARILNDPKNAGLLKDGDVLVTDITNPDWDPIMKKVAAVVTNKGGRTSHAAIVARELGVVAVVGTGDATEVIKDGQQITVSCAEGNEGKIYEGKLSWEVTTIDTRDLTLPETEVMLILADPDKAFKTSFLPNRGIGLMRMEFAINNTIKIHPNALIRFDELSDEDAKQQIEELTSTYINKSQYFIDKLSQAVATVAAAFHPHDVIVRMSDFKSNEYANLIGGAQFEPKEENPMLGFRGASRYHSPLYREGFRLECESMKIVRNEIGLSNVKLMIPFCRTVEEGKKVLDLMAEYGLQRGENGLEIYTMIEVPSNVIMAEEFAEIFDGFSIGSNDLTQLTLGLDRDSELVSELFNENDLAVKRMISQVISKAKAKGVKIGLCGQAPSDFPEFAKFLVDEGISSISFNPDALINGIKNIHLAEKSAD